MDSATTSKAAATGVGVARLKVVLLGEGAVGKTSVVLRYVDDKFNTKHFTTLQASFLNKRLNIAGQRVELNIWDTAGQERFHALGPIYYRDSQGAVLVFDVTDEESFNKVKTWVKELRRMLGDTVVLLICGNKIDLDSQRRVTPAAAQSYADSVGALYCESSAKLNQGVEELFLKLTKEMLAARERSATASAVSSARQNNVLVVNDTELPSNNRKNNCC